MTATTALAGEAVAHCRQAPSPVRLTQCTVRMQPSGSIVLPLLYFSHQKCLVPPITCVK